MLSEHFFTLQNVVYIYILYLVGRLLLWIYAHFIRKRKNLTERYGSNTWALITGATDGIGKGFAEELAKENFSIVLVGRNQEKLKKVVSELNSINKNIQTQIVVFDFSEKTSLTHYEESFRGVFLNLDIKILVNNVGVGIPSFFKYSSVRDIKTALDVNTIPQTVLTKFFIDKISSQSPESRSAIINLSSFTANFPFKASSIYTSTKAFNDYLSRSLSEDFNNQIDILSLKPLFVESNMTKMKSGKDGIFVITKNECASGALDHLGYDNVCYGHWKHEIQGALIEKFVPQSVINHIMHSRVMKKHKRWTASKKHE